MTTETLTSVLGDVIRNNAKTGKLLIRAYRAGSHRAVTRFGKGLGYVIDRTGEELSAAQRNKVSGVGHRFVKFADQSVGRAAEGAELALERLYKGATAMVETLDTNLAKVEGPLASRYVEFATNVTLPAAKLARVVSDRIVEGTARVTAASVAPKAAARVSRKPHRAKRVKKAS